MNSRLDETGPESGPSQGRSQVPAPETETETETEAGPETKQELETQLKPEPNPGPAPRHEPEPQPELGPQGRRELSPPFPPPTAEEIEVEFYNLLVEAGGRPVYDVRHLYEIIIYAPELYRSMMEPWQELDPVLPAWSGVFVRQFDRWRKFRTWQRDNRQCTDGAGSGAEEDDEAAVRTWHRREKRLGAGFVGYANAVVHRLALNGFAWQGLHLHPDPSLQDPLTTWVEYVNFEFWCFARAKKTVILLRRKHQQRRLQEQARRDEYIRRAEPPPAPDDLSERLHQAAKEIAAEKNMRQCDRVSRWAMEQVALVAAECKIFIPPPEAEYLEDDDDDDEPPRPRRGGCCKQVRFSDEVSFIGMPDWPEEPADEERPARDVSAGEKPAYGDVNGGGGDGDVTAAPGCAAVPPKRHVTPVHNGRPKKRLQVDA